MRSLINLEDKNIIITGAASGIGKACAKLFSELGATLLLLDINENGLFELSKELSSKHILKAQDLTDFELLKENIIAGKNELGMPFTGFVHCAGIPSIAPLRALSNNQYEKVQKINTQVGLNLAKIFSMKSCYNTEQQGAIVFISSVYGLVGSAANVAYAMSKAAVIGMTKSLAVELSPKNIRVNCVAPGFIKTNMANNISTIFDEQYEKKIESMHLLGWGEPLDIANCIAFLLSDAAKWITGSVFNVDGGFTAQ